MNDLKKDRICPALNSQPGEDRVSSGTRGMFLIWFKHFNIKFSSSRGGEESNLKIAGIFYGLLVIFNLWKGPIGNESLDVVPQQQGLGKVPDFFGSSRH